MKTLSSVSALVCISLSALSSFVAASEQATSPEVSHEAPHETLKAAPHVGTSDVHTPENHETHASESTGDHHALATLGHEKHASESSSDHHTPVTHETHAAQAPVVDRTPPCGVLESFSGDVQVLDSNRSKSVLLSLQTPLMCGSWVAANEGWAQIRYANQTVVHLGRDTLVQLLSETQPDHLILYKGHAYLQAGGGQQEFRLVTSTGRVRIGRGKVLVNFSGVADRTQLIGLQDSATLENRFEPNHRIQIHEGEITELDLSLQRVIPLLPKAVSLAELAPQMAELKISFADRALGEKAAAARSLASTPTEPAAEHSEHHASAEERAATDEHQHAAPSQGSHIDHVYAKHGHAKPPAKPKRISRSVASYQQNPSFDKNVSLHNHWVKKLGGGEAVVGQILNPAKTTVPTKKMQRAIAAIQAVERKHLKRQIESEQAAKTRLLKELSDLRLE